MTVSPLWDPKSPLWTDPLRYKGLSAEASAAFGLLGFISEDPDMKLVLSGRFPKAKFMSLQVYRGMMQGSSGVGGTLTDYMIQPNQGEKNPFQTGDPNDTGTFEIEITPDPAAKPVANNPNPKQNSIWYDPNPGEFGSNIITAFYRVYQPDPLGVTLSMSDLPEIKAVNFRTGDEIKLPQSQRLDWYLELPKQATDILGNPLLAILLEGIGSPQPLKFMTTESSAGSNKDAHYAFCFKSIPVGERVSVVKFRAPAINFNSQNSNQMCVRHWSICPIYYPMLLTLNGLPCDWNRPAERDVTLVFGPDTPQIRQKAAALGADFLPDLRKPDQKVMGFIVRNVVPSKSFEPHMFKKEIHPGGLFKDFEPHGNVYTINEFLHL